MMPCTILYFLNVHYIKNVKLKGKDYKFLIKYFNDTLSVLNILNSKWKKKNLMGNTNQKPIIDTNIKKKKQSKHNTKDGNQTTREENKEEG